MEQKIQQKKQIPTALKAILIYIGSGILGVIFSGPLGKLYRLVEGQYSGHSIFILSGENFSNFLAGFTFGYFLFLGLGVALFFAKVKKLIIVWVIGVLYFILAAVLTNDWMYFLYLIIFSLLGFLIGRVVLLIKDRNKN